MSEVSTVNMLSLQLMSSSSIWMMPGSLTGSPGPALFSLIITGLRPSAMDIIYILRGRGRITAKYILIITLSSLSWSGFAGSRKEILNHEVVMDEEHVKHLSLNYVGDDTFWLELLTQQEHVEPLQVHSH